MMMVNIIHDIVKRNWFDQINRGFVPRSINNEVITNNMEEKDLTVQKLNKIFGMKFLLYVDLKKKKKKCINIYL